MWQNFIIRMILSELEFLKNDNILGGFKKAKRCLKLLYLRSNIEWRILGFWYRFISVIMYYSCSLKIEK